MTYAIALYQGPTSEPEMLLPNVAGSPPRVDDQVFVKGAMYTVTYVEHHIAADDCGVQVCKVRVVVVKEDNEDF